MPTKNGTGQGPSNAGNTRSAKQDQGAELKRDQDPQITSTTRRTIDWVNNVPMWYRLPGTDESDDSEPEMKMRKIKQEPDNE